jgi:riboflavin kinase/FMN adenylyltransferase
MKKIACIGNFDGVHLGHQSLIRKVIELSGDYFIPSVITFEPDPEIVFSNKEKKYLTILNQKKEYLFSLGIKEIIVVHFTKEISYISKDSFVQLFLNNFDLDTLVCGKDFKFGHKGEGSSDFLIKTNIKNFKVDVLEHVLYNDEKISSTLIGNLIREGNLNLARKLLNHDYSIEADIFKSEILTENIVPLKGEYDVLVNCKKYKIKDNTINLPDIKKVKMIFI